MKQNMRRLEVSNEVNTELVRRLKNLLTFAQASDTTVEQKQRLLSEVAYCVRIARGEGSGIKSRPVSNPQAPTYDDMIDSLYEQIQEKIEEEIKGKDTAPEAKFHMFVDMFKQHLEKLEDVLKRELKEYDDLVEERSRHIVSEDIHTGFDTTLINEKVKEEEKKAATTKKTEKTETIEVINSPSASSSSAAQNPPVYESDDDVKSTPEGKKFAKIPIGDYEAVREYLHMHPSIINEREKDGLLMDAFEYGFNRDTDSVRRIVHNALILQYCATLGRNYQAVDRFITKLATKPSEDDSASSQVKTAFSEDVEKTTNHILNRVEILREEREKGNDGDDEEEAIIQLHFPGQKGDELTVNIPPEDAEGDEQLEQIREAYLSLPDDLREALESKSLKKVNEVLAKIPYENAEVIVKFLDNTGIIDFIGNGVLDPEEVEKIEAERQKLEDTKISEVDEEEKSEK